ncbi:flagellar basal body P-ring formation protein FlgA [Massilia sp. B-10]|nr:flagellar basal body P-ring formation protein FlgA [Massilia sp. B-10]
MKLAFTLILSLAVGLACRPERARAPGSGRPAPGRATVSADPAALTCRARWRSRSARSIRACSWPPARPPKSSSSRARAWGKTTVGVRCAAPAAWTVYIQAQVSVQAEYVAAAMPLAQGQAIEAAQLTMVKGDLAALPNGVLTDMAQAVGKTSTLSLPSGAPVRAEQLRSKPVVQQGQAVRVVSGGAWLPGVGRGQGHRQCLAEGQVVQVRTPGGAILSGVARAGGLVEVVF